MLVSVEHGDANVVFDGTNAHGLFDVPVDLPKRNCYVHLWSPQKTYFVDLGWSTEQGSFFCIGRSNTAHTPSAWPSEGGAHLPAQSDVALERTKGPEKIGKRDVPDSEIEHETEQRPRHSDSKQAGLRTTPFTAFWDGRVDLSAVNENAFQSGVSSAQMPSSREGKDRQED